jgi:hypothetical protein
MGNLYSACVFERTWHSGPADTSYCVQANLCIQHVGLACLYYDSSAATTNCITRCDRSPAPAGRNRGIDFGSRGECPDRENEVGRSRVLQLRFRISHRLGRDRQVLRETEVLFSADTIQTLGDFPTTVEYVDFLSAGAHTTALR